jgi:hypothetical protein
MDLETTIPLFSGKRIALCKELDQFSEFLRIVHTKGCAQKLQLVSNSVWFARKPAAKMQLVT